MAELLSTGQLAIDQIEANDRLRPVNPASVQALVESIGQLGGVMIHDVSVRVIISKDGTTRHVLMAGGHRLAAAKALGWIHLPTKIYRCDDIVAALIEVDDNLANAQLSTLDLCNFIAERKRLFLLLKPHLRKGNFFGNQYAEVTAATAVTTDAEASAILAFDPTQSFAEGLAAKRDLSVRQVYNLQRIGEKLNTEQKRVLGSQPKEPTQRELLDLADLEPDARDAAIQLIANGDAPSLKHAVAAVHPRRKPIHVSITDSQVKAISLPWSRANRQAQEDFVRLHRARLESCLASILDEQEEGEQS